MNDANSTKRPRLQVGLPVYNGANYLAEAIDALLAQTFTDFELIISDNGSTDETQQIGEKYAHSDPRVRYYRYDVNRGAAWNFNNVVHLSDAELFKWAAHDDLHHPEFLERCIEVLDREPEVILCYTRTSSADADGNIAPEIYSDRCDLRETSPAARYARTLGLYAMHVAFGVVRREKLAATRLWGGYASADRVSVSELALQGQICELPEPLFIRRWHSGVSWTVDTKEADYDAWYDPANKDKRLSVPKLRRGLEYAKAIHHAQLPPLEAAKAYGAWAKFAFWTQGISGVLRKAKSVAGGATSRSNA